MAALHLLPNWRFAQTRPSMQRISTTDFDNGWAENDWRKKEAHYGVKGGEERRWTPCVRRFWRTGTIAKNGPKRGKESNTVYVLEQQATNESKRNTIAAVIKTERTIRIE